MCLCRLLGLPLLFHSKFFEEPLQMILSRTMLDCTVFHYLTFSMSRFHMICVFFAFPLQDLGILPLPVATLLISAFRFLEMHKSSGC